MKTDLQNTNHNRSSEPLFIKASEIGEIMEISPAYAYRIIKQLNDELSAKGYIVVQGRTNRQYFYERIYRKVSWKWKILI